MQSRIVGHANIAPDQLLAHEGNYRRHNGEQLDTLRGSLRQLGWVKSVLVSKRTGKVIDGHARVEEALRQGLATVPVEFVDLSEEEGRLALAVLDPITGMAYHDDEALAALLGEVPAVDEPALRDLLADLFDPFALQRVDVTALKPHPLNYRKHPEDQLQHIIASIKQHGFYRNVIVARDATILAGHGVVEAARRMGKRRIPVIKLNLDPQDPRALKVLTSDNEISKLAESDDRALTELLKGLLSGPGLDGTGYNEQQLAALAMVTRPASEIRDLNEAAEWVGMPGYEEGGTPIKLVITFPDDDSRREFCDSVGLRMDKQAIKGTTYSTRWPWSDRVDAASIRFEQREPSAGD